MNKAATYATIPLLTLLMHACTTPRPVPETAAISNHYMPMISFRDCQRRGKGFAWAFFGERQPGQADMACVSWYHRWTTREQPEQIGIEFVQHLWCGQLLATATERLGSGFNGYLLFLNEPDHPEQCAVSPAEGARIYRDARVAMPNARLIGPQVSHLDYDTGWSWLQQWRVEVISLTGVPPDVYAYSMHNYNRSPDGMTSSLHGLMNSWGEGHKPIWVTEYGSCSPAFIAEATRFYDTDSRIERYALFAPRWNDPECYSAFDGSGLLAPVGEAFADPYP